MLGVLSVILGGTLYICRYSTMIIGGAAFWTGIVVSAAT